MKLYILNQNSLRLFTTPKEYHFNTHDRWYITGNLDKFLSPENLEDNKLSNYTVSRTKVRGSENSAFIFTLPTVIGTQYFVAVESDCTFYWHPVKVGVPVGVNGYAGTKYQFYGLCDVQWNLRANEDKEQLSRTLKEAFEKRVSQYQCLSYGIPYTVRYSRVPETSIDDSGYESLESKDSQYSGQLKYRIDNTVQTETKKYMCGISRNWYTLKKPDGVQKKITNRKHFIQREATGLGQVKNKRWSKNPPAAKQSTVKDPEDITGLE